jgi:hypothetical protein
LITFFNAPIDVVDKAVTGNGPCSPSMRHQRLYVDILGGSEKLEKEKGRCSGRKRKGGVVAAGGGRLGRKVGERVVINRYQQVSININ